MPLQGGFIPLILSVVMIGKTGTVKISHREYNGSTYNDVKEFVISDTPAPTQPQGWGNNSWK